MDVLLSAKLRSESRLINSMNKEPAVLSPNAQLLVLLAAIASRPGRGAVYACEGSQAMKAQLSVSRTPLAFDDAY